ncbi:guanine deaminase [Roseovarius mucosus DSM 17069]|uniref:Guanine deaminase n=2 Tax=Roseovarius mucosus TaxID=215743 RepID=A0A0A0HQP7_9RHOB|nr:guanine deaminase [Roseovarius mucosus DSM 17069]
MDQFTPVLWPLILLPAQSLAHGGHMSAITLLIGQILAFDRSPFADDPQGAARLHEALLIENGRITALGTAQDLRAQAPQATVTDMGTHLITAGFVDAHVHYPQTAIIASWGKRLIEWLNTYTFPEEMRFADPTYAAEIATRYLDLMLAHGTTTCASYATIHPASVTAFFEAAQARGLRAVAGKTCMDRNAPDGLRDTAQSAYDDSKALLTRWHGVDRLSYAITPRFSPTSTPDQLAALGALWSEYPDCLMQTHLSEQVDEVAWVKSLYPEARDYLDTYESHGLLGARGLYGHAIYLDARERDRLREVGAALIHCPTSNIFIGSGCFNLAARMAEGQRVGLATDTGGGSSFSMLRTMAAAYEIGQLTGTALHPAQLLWLATAGSAEALHMGARIGNIAPGMEADLVALDLASTPAIAQRSARATDIWEALFPTIMMGDDRAIAGVWVAGKAV